MSFEIDEKTKGIPHYNDDYNPAEEIHPDIDEDVLEVLYDERTKFFDEQEAKEREWENRGEENFDRLIKNHDAIHNRLYYLIIEHALKLTDVAARADVGRTTLYRYIYKDSNRTEKFNPSKKTLRKIIDALDMSVAEFSFEPDDFDKWKSVITESFDKAPDIIELKTSILKSLSRTTFVYKSKGQKKRLPYRHYVALKSAIESSFKILDILNHDEYDAK